MRHVAHADDVRLAAFIIASAINLLRKKLEKKTKSHAVASKQRDAGI